MQEHAHYQARFVEMYMRAAADLMSASIELFANGPTFVAKTRNGEQTKQRRAVMDRQSALHQMRAANAALSHFLAAVDCRESSDLSESIAIFDLSLRALDARLNGKEQAI